MYGDGIIFDMEKKKAAAFSQALLHSGTEDYPSFFRTSIY